MSLTFIVKNCSNRIEWNSVEITPTFFKNADHMFHKFEIKDDELLPYTDKNDFINGTLFTLEYILNNLVKVRNIYLFF